MTISPADFDFVRQLVRKEAAILLDDGKEYLAEARLNLLVRQEGIGTLHELIARVRHGHEADLRRKIVECMTTNETSFFRDIHPFEAIRDLVLPDMMKRRANLRRINVWCAACSSGQEPYSLAMMIRDRFPELVADWSLRILATDLSCEMVDRARRGRYTQMEVGRGVPAPFLIKYFRRDGLDWEICPEVRRMVEFQTMNLMGTWNPVEAADIVLMRNVLIYFDNETKRKLLSRVRGVMKDDGYLFLGGTESTLFADDVLERTLLGRTIAYRLPGRQPPAAGESVRQRTVSS